MSPAAQGAAAAAEHGAAPAAEPEPFPFDQLFRGMAISAGGMDVPTGTTPRDVVWTLNKTTLYRYRSEAPRRHGVPVLLVYALINKPYILDLRPGASFVRHLLDEGYDVFLLDWGTPGWEDRGTSLDDLVGEHLPKAVARMARASGAREYTLFGYCMGGTLGLMHAALRPDGLRNLVTLTAPVDFAEAGAHGLWTDPRFMDPWALAAAFGNVPGDLIDLGNKMLKPVTNFLGTQMTMWDRLLAGKDLTSWLAMNKWVNDGVPFPGVAFAQWIEGFYQRNRLVSGRMTIADRRVDLGAIDCSLLNIAGERDHIVPPAMARPLNDRVSSDDTEFHLLPAGHVGLLAGSGARRSLWPAVTDWLNARSD